MAENNFKSKISSALKKMLMPCKKSSLTVSLIRILKVAFTVKPCQILLKYLS